MGPKTRILLTASRYSSAVFDEPTYLQTTRGLITGSHMSRVSPPRHVGGHDEVTVQELAGGGALLRGLPSRSPGSPAGNLEISIVWTNEKSVLSLYGPMRGASVLSADVDQFDV